ncbi:MAG: hypothetical protein LBB76_12825 [Azoarcus sp.]|jgi:hypothetical protein|nr:hypothetical protein [Azoarcus sp.]
MNTTSNGIRPWLSVLALSAASLFMAQNALAEIVGTRGGDKGDQVKQPSPLPVERPPALPGK